MYLAKDLVGLPVYDGSEVVVGTVDGIGVNFDSSHAFLVVKGEVIKQVRDRVRELIPFMEVYEIKDGKIYLKPTSKELEEIIKRIPERQILINTLAKNIKGFNVFDSRGEFIGKVSGGAIERNQGKLFLIITGKKIKTIRNHEYEMIPANEVSEVDEQITLSRPFSGIKELVMKEHPFGWDKI